MAAETHPALAFRARVQLFVRRFGLLRDAETPCGRPLHVSHAHALMFLLERMAPSMPTLQKDLAEALGLDKSNVARLCARMEAAGHVVRERTAEDGRAREVRLTPKGIRVAREAESASRARFDRVLAAIPRAERPRVLAALDSLIAAASSAGGEEDVG